MAFTRHKVRVEVDNYSLLVQDDIAWFDIATDKTATLPTLKDNMQYSLLNFGPGILTIARNGANINGTAEDITLAAEEGITLVGTVAKGWWVMPGGSI